VKALFGHCTDRDASAGDMVASGLRQKFMPRLSGRAQSELIVVEGILQRTLLQESAIVAILQSQRQPRYRGNLPVAESEGPTK